MTARTLTRHTYALQLHSLSQRLLHLIELGAPEMVIESERQLVLKAVLDFPVDSTAQARCRIFKVQELLDEATFLKENKYKLRMRDELVVDANALDAIFGRC